MISVEIKPSFGILLGVMNKFLVGVLSGIFLMVVFVAGGAVERIWGLPILSGLNGGSSSLEQRIDRTIVTEESVVTDVAEKVSPAVVTVSYKQKTPVMESFFLDPFGMFRGQRPSGEFDESQVDIGTGFVVDSVGLVVTNKHVVSSGNPEDYSVILKDETEHKVEKIWRDALNDLAILKIEGSGFQAVTLGDSDQLKVGNYVIAIGTALGEFRHTVTTGVVSGLGRGITAGDSWGSFAEQLDNVIQTDAAINPGNSGGPLINSAGQVIGVNVAVSQSANNVGFALPINVVKESIKNFNEGGQFERAFLGVRYQVINRETAIMNEVPAGAYVREVVEGSTAAEAGLEVGDIITKFDGEKLDQENELAILIAKKKIGDLVDIEYWRQGETKNVTVTLKGE